MLLDYRLDGVQAFGGIMSKRDEINRRLEPVGLRTKGPVRIEDVSPGRNEILVSWKIEEYSPFQRSETDRG
jgi:hypothetical protein